MATTYSHVLEPITLGKLKLNNRVVMVPMGTEMGDHDGHLTDREIAYYAERAAGAGQVLPCLTLEFAGRLNSTIL